MASLGFERNQKSFFTTKATIVNNKKRTPQGSIDVTFYSNSHSGDGPYIMVDEVIKSYGIMYVEFQPKWQQFIFHREKLVLNIKGKDYNFDLGFTNKHK